ncbi:auxin resistant family protein [Salix suchowensis]|nr:auxin resistant family protein [Salix suchowensis]
MAEPKAKYDRQLRIWGEHGQAALEKATICLLNCGPTGSETLKNLVLGGVGSITVIDGSKVEPETLAIISWVVDESCVGQSKAKCVCTFLQELNDAVKAKFIEEYPSINWLKSLLLFAVYNRCSHSGSVDRRLAEDSMIKLDKICREANVLLIFARSYGLTGFVRISVKTGTCSDRVKPDHFLDDLRLNNPWPELKRFAETIDLNMTDPVAHKHTPYVVILVKIVEEWTKAHSGALPSTRDEKKEFKVYNQLTVHLLDNYKEAIEASFKVFASRGISEYRILICLRIMHDSCSEVESNSSDFWVMVAALKEFIANEGGEEAPLEGSIPDMTSSTELYVSLQKIYQAKAEADFLIGRDPDSISKEMIKSFCKNARKLKICRYRPIEDEFNNPSVAELQKNLTDEEYSVAMGFYILLRAVDRFAANYNSFLGNLKGKIPEKLTSYSEMDEDISRLKTAVVGLLSDLGCNGTTVTEDLIKKFNLNAIITYTRSQISCSSQLITKQFVPMVGTFIFNSIDQRSQLLVL